MSDLGDDSEPLHRSGNSCCASVAAPATDNPRWLQEKDRGNSKASSDYGTQVREVRDDELENVSGGAGYTFSTVYVDSIVVTKPTDAASTNWSWGANQTGTH